MLCGMVALFAHTNIAHAKVQGTFTRTCVNWTVSQNSLLTGICETMDGKWVSTQLASVNLCRGDIWNYDGHLMCNPGKDGSYLQTCGEARLDRDNLTAHCKRRDGSFLRSELTRVSLCKGDLSNNDGRLECQR
jgi:hypothetical protein